jgi:hypothetical protein
MPKQGAYPLKSIPRKALSFDYGGGNGNSSTTIIQQGGSADLTPDKIIECGETILPGWGIWWGDDGIAYNASLLAEDGKPAMSIAVSGGVAGDSTKHRPAGYMILPGIENTADNTLWLADGDSNISDECPDIVAGNYLQILGRIVAAELVFIQIGLAEEII